MLVLRQIFACNVKTCILFRMENVYLLKHSNVKIQTVLNVNLITTVSNVSLNFKPMKIPMITIMFIVVINNVIFPIVLVVVQILHKVVNSVKKDI